MGILSTLGLAFGSAWLSGINLYAMVATLGLLGRFADLKLPGDLGVLTNWWIIGIASTLYVIEFVADKVPVVDSAWDVVHTFIRVPAGAIVAAAALGDFNPAVQVGAALVGGGLALSSHGTKAAVRVVANHSPEPVSNVMLSGIEDVIAFGGTFLAAFAPVIMLAVVVVAVIVTAWVLPKLYRIARARDAGIHVHEGVRFDHLIEEDARIAGIGATDGTEYRADVMVVAAGAWTPSMLTQLRELVWVSAHPVFHFHVSDVPAFRPPRFSCWTADISQTGWYGFPALEDGTVKVANHGPGRTVDPDGPRQLDDLAVERCREFLRGSFPILARSPLVEARLCLYCDSWDGNFLIDHDPDRPGLVIATGDSGHAFKFAPVLGDVIADVVERVPNRFAERFRWRARGALGSEDARFTGSDRSGRKLDQPY